jgi:peptidoglycan/LPS O-acetylase OafA/YrhL
MMNPTKPQSQSHIQAIDGLRGVAILAVVIFHWVVQPYSPAPPHSMIQNILELLAYGVDLFFVISGFLIGGILLKVAKKPSGIANFYRRRILRIWPLYYLLLGVVFLAGGGPQVFGAIPYWSFFLFIFNFWECSGLRLHIAFAPLWSLAVEEQFYLAGPLIFSFLKRRQLMYLSAFWVLASPFLRWTLMMNTRLGMWVFTPARLDGICIGIFLSILMASQETIAPLLTRGKLLRVSAFLLLVTSVICRAVLPDIYWYSFGNSLMVLSFGLSLMIVLTQYLSRLEDRILNSTVLRYLGFRCYSIYLFHILFMILVSASVGNVPAGLAIQTLLTLGFAHMSWRYIEHPLIKLGQRLTYQES